MDVEQPDPDTVIPMDSASNIARTVSSTDLLDEDLKDEFMETSSALFVRVLEWRDGVSSVGNSADLATPGCHTVLESDPSSNTVISAIQPLLVE